jgi:hypothetical protein
MIRLASTGRRLVFPCSKSVPPIPARREVKREEPDREMLPSRFHLTTGLWHVDFTYINIVERQSHANRQGFSHREADEKSLLDEASRRGIGGSGHSEWSCCAR